MEKGIGWRKSRADEARGLEWDEDRFRTQMR